MTEYKRLTDKTKKEALVDCHDCPYCGVEYLYDCHIKVCNRLAELEDKIENGLLIELPCKVGDTLYIIFKRQWSVANKTTYWNIQKTKLTYGNMDRVIKEYGEFVFLTREKAEQRLKELKND